MKHLLIVLLCALTFTLTASAQDSKPSPELVVHLLDYLAKDYGGAVQGGKVISKSEYAEQVEFAVIVGKNANSVPALSGNSEFMAQVTKLKSMIDSKTAPEEVAALARTLQQSAISLAGIDVAPRGIPDLANGARLFQTACISCHGNTGRGDGPAGASLDPKPANFHDKDLVLASAPYKFFNTVRLGVPGTGMMAFSYLTDSEVWDLAFYLKSLPYSEAQATGVQPASFSLAEAATLTDAELTEKLGGDPQAAAASVGSLRAIGAAPSGEDPLAIAQNHLNESMAAVKAGDYSKANELSLRAYLEGIEPLEPKIKANLPGYVEEIEGLMSKYRSGLDARASASQMQSLKLEIFAKLGEIKKLFAQSKMSPGVAFGAAFSIFLREGFEAVLIIVILISILRAMKQEEAIKWVHVGWSTAIAVGIAAWFASGLLLSMSGLSRELLEGGISLLAVLVLIYVGFWLHRYSEMKKWRAFLETKLKAGLNKGSYLGLAVVAFMAVFREAFEVVLFLRAIWIDLDPSGQSIAGLGVLSSLLILIVLSYFAVKESKKLPLARLFQICSWTMMVLAVILIGKGLHSLQEAGYVGVRPAPIPIRVDLLGVYPTLQTLVAQAVLIALFAFLLLNDRKSAAHAH
ncbi:MAG: c-type cytochrome [Proteobacteria bacterium]|nr:MAG: c-type cytochrome [Pseudomonadota bacterium]